MGSGSEAVMVIEISWNIIIKKKNYFDLTMLFEDVTTNFENQHEFCRLKKSHHLLIGSQNCCTLQFKLKSLPNSISNKNLKKEEEKRNSILC